MYKVKHARTCDAVVAGFRWHKDGPIVGSLLLGLYDDEGRLHHVGVSASFTRERRAELVEELAPYREGVVEHPWNWGQASLAENAEAAAAAGQRLPGGVSRWTGKKNLEFVPCAPNWWSRSATKRWKATGSAIPAQFKRWRPDREPRSCTYDQLERPLRFDVDDVLAGK